MTTTPPEDPDGPQTPPTPPPPPQTPPPPPQGQGPQGYEQPGYHQPGATAYGGAGYSAQAPLSDSDQRLWATLAHAGGIIFSFIAPLIIWLVFKDRGRYVDEQSKEALNWHITLVLAYIVGWLTSFLGIGVLIVIAVVICGVIFGILAAVAANRGDAYRYPFALRLIK